MAQQDEIQIQLDELDTRLERLRALYEQYFCGIERIEPHVQRKDVERRVQVLRKVQLRNTAARFRFQALVQKYTTYQTYWQRVTRQIEEGTFRRDQIRQQRYGTAKPKVDLDDAPVLEIGADDVSDAASLDDLDEVFEKPAAVAKPATPPRAEPAAAVTQARTERVVEELPLPFTDSIPPPVVEKVAAPVAAPVPPPKPAAAPPVRRAGLSVFGAAPGAKPASPPGARPVPPPAMKVPAPAAKPTATTPSPEPLSKPAAVVVPIVKSPAPPVAAAPRTNGEEPQVRELYERYRESRKQTGEGDVSFDAVARQVRDTLPKLAEKFPGADVSLDVTVKDGRTVLRPVVKKK